MELHCDTKSCPQHCHDNLKHLSGRETEKGKLDFYSQVTVLNIFIPKISYRFSPNNTRNIKDENRRVDMSNIFSNNRIGSNDTIEGGQSITLGANYKKNNVNNTNKSQRKSRLHDWLKSHIDFAGW